MHKDNIKNFYQTYHDAISDKRLNSPYALRQYVHKQQHQSFLNYIKPGDRVLDAGCGDGALAFLLAAHGAHVVGCDISSPNVVQCKEKQNQTNLSNLEFLEADLENLPFPDSSFDLVVSSHVLEHLPDFNRGLRELLRVSKKRVIFAVPSLPNPCSMVQVGGGWFYLKGLRSFAGFFLGLIYTVAAYILGQDGVNENYVGEKMPHVFRFARTVKKAIKAEQAKLISYEADSVCLPYFSSLLPVIKKLNQKRDYPIIRNFGYGTMFIVEKD